MAARGSWIGRLGITSGLMLLSLALVPRTGRAHCDGLDGPVVAAARRALWVQAKDEAEIRRAFAQTLGVRKLSPQARDLADLYFFEMLVRVHRAGEGASYTGLKPAGRDLGPAIPAADRALSEGSIEKVINLLTEAVSEGLHRRFHAVSSRKGFAPDDVKAGREFVEAYVPYIHYVERLWRDATSAARGHHSEHAEEAEHID